MRAVVADANLHLFSVAKYMRLDIPGRTELLGGLIYDVSPKNGPHSLAVSRISSAFAPGLDLRTYRVRIQDPIAVKGWTGRYAPEVDIAVATEKLYRSTPIADDSFAFREVSDTTYADDREEKMPLFVESGVPT